MSAAGTKTANAVGGKTARACDSCVRKRARWYCAADDAFLCHSCDGSVHSANQLARRHERVLLETASCNKLSGLSIEPSAEPTWHQGLTRKARTPRQRTKSSSLLKSEGRNVDAKTNSSVHRLVPEMGDLEASLMLEDNDDEEELLYHRVPVFDAFEAELCNASIELAHERSLSFETCTNLDDLQLAGFDHLQSTTDDLELMEFAADVESLLGKGFDDTKTSCRINIDDDDDDLGLSTINNNYDYKLEEYDNNNMGICFDENRVKVEDKEEVVEAILGFDDHLDAISRETVLLNCDDHFDYHEPPMMMMMMIKEEDQEEKGVNINEEHMMMKSISIISLRLNYEDVINTWADQGLGSPWTNGTRPKLNSDGSWPDPMESESSQWLMGNYNASYGGGGGGGSDGGREARVSRYREKRRRRLFSKKIRYEVRKLNAEKRPRMKGRFVKRETS